MAKFTTPATRFHSVLLIDDNDLDNFINEKVMQAYQFASYFYKAVNGREALDMLAEMGAENKFPDAIFIDLNMPVMDGFQVLEQLNSGATVIPDNTVLVVLTSSANEGDKDRALAIAPQIRFLNKPLTASSLAQLM